MYLKGVDFFQDHKHRIIVTGSDSRYNCGPFQVKSISEHVRLGMPFGLVQNPAHPSFVESIKHQLAIADSTFKIGIEVLMAEDIFNKYTKIYHIEMAIVIREYRMTGYNEVSIYAHPKTIYETYAKKLHAFCRKDLYDNDRASQFPIS